MADNLTPEHRKKAMRAVKSKGTKPERILFSMLAGMHLNGWKKNVDNLTGKPDVVFYKNKVAIFVDGCFWHGCSICKKIPDSNKEYWQRKINRNIELSKEYTFILEDEGWIVIRLWEHQLYDLNERNKIRLKIKDTLMKEPIYGCT